VEIASFLARHAPFDAMERNRLDELAGRVKTEQFTAGTAVLQQSGEPSRFLYLVRQGSVEILDDGNDERAGALRGRRGRRDPMELRFPGRGEPRRRRHPPRAGGAERGGDHMSRTEWEAVLTLPVDEERDHIEGASSATVTLVQYGDYECPYCGEAYPIIKDVQAQMGDRLRFVFRNFPISTSHPHAEHAAEAAEAADAQGEFWRMHDLLYERQRHLADEDLHAYAEELGLDVERFDKEMAEHVHAARVREDFMSGVRSGVNGTPTFYINGVRHDDSYEAEVLLEALERAAATP
jgi:protein-disulfide isomerase